MCSSLYFSNFQVIQMSNWRLCNDFCITVHLFGLELYPVASTVSKTLPGTVTSRTLFWCLLCSIVPILCCIARAVPVLHLAFAFEPHIWCWLGRDWSMSWVVLLAVWAWALSVLAIGDCSSLIFYLPAVFLVLSVQEFPWRLKYLWSCSFLLVFSMLLFSSKWIPRLVSNLPRFICPSTNMVSGVR